MVNRTHEPCPFCTSSDAFSYNTENGQFYCFSCQAKPSTKGCLIFDGQTKKPLEREPQEEGINLEPYLPNNYRGISKKVLEKFGVYFTKVPKKQAVDFFSNSPKNIDKKYAEWLKTQDLEFVETVHWSYPNGVVKQRSLPKHIKINGQMDKFFGQEDYQGGKTITITEGEEDRFSVIEMMGDYPTVSVPNASPSKSFWDNAVRYLSNFEKIILSIDNDPAGDTLCEKFAQLFPGKCYRVNHGGFKDPNEFLQNGKDKEYKAAWWNAQKVKLDSILGTEQDFLKLYNETPEYEYFETGIPELDEKMLGIHKGAFTIVLAETGIGKTEFFRYLEWKCKEAGYSFAACHGEEQQLRSLLGLVSYDLETNVTRKDLIESGGYNEKVEESIKRLTKDESIYLFSIKVEEDVDDIISRIRYLKNVLGVDFIFLEPIQDFVSGTGQGESGKEALLTDLTNKLKRLASEINVGIVCIAHANKEGDAKYCASIVQGAAFEIRLKRDQDSEDNLVRNTTEVFVGRKNRTGNGSGPAGRLIFDVESYMLTLPEQDSLEQKDEPVVKEEVKREETDDSIPF